MKLLKPLAVAALALAAFVQTSSAVTIYITGSSAFRTAANAAISANLTGATMKASTGSIGFIWTGGSMAGFGAVTVKATYTGSGNGIQTVAASGTGTPLTVAFVNDAFVNGGADPVSTASGIDNHVPDFAFSDVFPGATDFTSDNGYDDLVDNKVAICTFKWIASKNFPAGLSVDPQFLQYLFTAGKAPLSFLTGNSSDEHAVIFATGRDPDSGTRITAFADSGVGISTPVLQYKPVISAGAVTSHALYPIQTINGVSTGTAGNSGESSGATLRGNLTATLPTSGLTDEAAGTTAAYYISYLGIKDAASVAANTTELAYKGVLYGTNSTASTVPMVQEGKYSFWSYEHIVNDPNYITAPASTFYTSVKNTIQGYATGNANLDAGIQDDAAMHVKRDNDGSKIKPKFAF
ncbi:MAG TPA: hypothetical protein VK961_28475 [Chthoniobacter sp.]|nr:hypothetical protein [Chthoniobacter sp.]